MFKACCQKQRTANRGFAKMGADGSLAPVGVAFPVWRRNDAQLNVRWNSVPFPTGAFKSVATLVNLYC
jgi:hypothetical protein